MECPDRSGCGVHPICADDLVKSMDILFQSVQVVQIRLKQEVYAFLQVIFRGGLGCHTGVRRYEECAALQEHCLNTRTSRGSWRLKTVALAQVSVATQSTVTGKAEPCFFPDCLFVSNGLVPLKLMAAQLLELLFDSVCSLTLGAALLLMLANNTAEEAPKWCEGGVA